MAPWANSKANGGRPLADKVPHGWMVLHSDAAAVTFLKPRGSSDLQMVTTTVDLQRRRQTAERQAGALICGLPDQAAAPIQARFIPLPLTIIIGNQGKPVTGRRKSGRNQHSEPAFPAATTAPGPSAAVNMPSTLRPTEGFEISR